MRNGLAPWCNVYPWWNMQYELMGNHAASSSQSEGWGRVTHCRPIFSLFGLRDCLLCYIMRPKEKLLKGWLPQLIVLEYPTYFSPMIAWCLEEQQWMKSQKFNLKVYEASSRQQLNCHKTSLFFSPNTDNGIKERVKTMIGAQVIKPHEAYLGLPSLVERSKNNTFA